jgi:hypothetical protein
MTALELMHALQEQPFAVAIAESDWLFAFLETAHVLALTLVVGSIAMLDFRLLGVGQRNRAISELTSTVLPWTWTAFAIAASAGLLLFSSKASTYFLDIPFRIKMVCMVLAGVNMLVFHLSTSRSNSTWDVGPPPGRVRAAGAISLALWITIVATGRWIGFTT